MRKRNFLMVGLTVLSLSAFGAGEVQPERVFVPAEGYDDNDQIQLVLAGRLENGCLELGQTRVEKDLENRVIRVRQFAVGRELRMCLEGKMTVPDYLRIPVRYAVDVSVGQLPAGEYRVLYGKEGAEGWFRVSAARTDRIDDVPYAPVGSVFVPELIYETDRAEILLTGILENGCLDVRTQVRVERVGDVFIVLPRLEVAGGDRPKGRRCDPVPRPIEQVVTLGSVKTGQYLVHVRSMSGRAVNRVFTVVKAPHDSPAGE